MELKIQKEFDFVEFLIKDCFMIIKKEDLEFEEVIELIKEKYENVFNEN